LQPTIHQPKTLADYKKTNFEVLARDVHPIDQIEFHKQVGEMIYSTLTRKAMAAHRLQDSLDNVTAQYKLEKAFSQAKDKRIKSLEDLAIELGHDRSDIKAAKRLIKKKNEDIASLKKQLKLPHLQHPQTKEVLESQTNHEEMMDLVLQLNDQLKEMEKELDNLIQLKRDSLDYAPTTVIPIVTTVVPSTLETSLAPTAPMATTLLASIPTTLAIGLIAMRSTGDEANRLVKAME